MRMERDSYTKGEGALDQILNGRRVLISDLDKNVLVFLRDKNFSPKRDKKFFLYI